MGLNIGISVKAQTDGGRNPLGTIEEVEQSFFRFLHLKFPKGGFGSGWVNLRNGVYDFDVRMFRYGSEFQDNGYTIEQMWLAITEYIYSEFSHEDGIEMSTYWSG